MQPLILFGFPFWQPVRAVMWLLLYKQLAKVDWYPRYHHRNVREASTRALQALRGGDSVLA